MKAKKPKDPELAEALRGLKQLAGKPKEEMKKALDELKSANMTPLEKLKDWAVNGQKKNKMTPEHFDSMWKALGTLELLGAREDLMQSIDTIRAASGNDTNSNGKDQ